MMTVTQATATIQKFGAQYHSQRDGVTWYREPNGNWIAWRTFANGQVELRRLPPSACNC